MKTGSRKSGIEGKRFHVSMSDRVVRLVSTRLCDYAGYDENVNAYVYRLRISAVITDIFSGRSV